MKIKFKSSFHRKAFVKYISENISNPYCCRREYIAALFLLSADKLLWKRACRDYIAYSMKFDDLDLKGISIEGYALFMAAKGIYCDGADISLNELCDVNLIDDSTVLTIFAGVMLVRNGVRVLNGSV